MSKYTIIYYIYGFCLLLINKFAPEFLQVAGYMFIISTLCMIAEANDKKIKQND